MKPEVPRTGAWVDTVQISMIPTTSVAIDALQSGDIHFYTRNRYEPGEFERVVSDPELAYYTTLNGYNELTFNPAGPVFSGTGKLNPFDVPEIREAMNWLIDREEVIASTINDIAVPQYTLLNITDWDYTRYHEKVAELETTYGYNPSLAETIITAEMLGLGAYKVGDDWYYDGEQVELIFIIRSEDERTQIGDYISDQLEAIGFTVDRRYLPSFEAQQYWLNSDPDDGTWHLYTGGWITYNVERNSQTSFGFFYTPRGENYPLWQAYTPSTIFDYYVGKLYTGDYDDMDERDLYFEEALDLSMEDSSRVWTNSKSHVYAYRNEARVAFDRVGGLNNSDLWTHTIRFAGEEGGEARIAKPEMISLPWNPISGHGRYFDEFLRKSTSDQAVIVDPNTGIHRPQRIISAEVTAQTGLPMIKTLDWVTLTFSDTIQVPDDAWSDWDAVNQTWITAADRFTETQTCRVKTEVHYETDLFEDMTWHDGSPSSIADFIMYAILQFDHCKVDSPIYDESANCPNPDTFYGWRITSEDPLVVAYYTDDWTLDAENQVTNAAAMYPLYETSQAPWHTIAVGYLAEEAGELAFSQWKADNVSGEWMDFLTEPSLSILETYLIQARADSFIPYSNTLGTYVTPAQAFTRYDNLKNWVDAKGHFWIGSGLLYLDSYDLDAGTMILRRNPDYPDESGRWDAFIADPSPVHLSINYPSGAPGSAFNISGTHFPVYAIGWVSVNNTQLGSFFTGSTGDFTLTLTTDLAAEDGTYFVEISVNPKKVVQFVLDSEEPLRPVEGSHETFAIPAEIDPYNYFIHLPLLIE